MAQITLTGSTLLNTADWDQGSLTFSRLWDGSVQSVANAVRSENSSNSILKIQMPASHAVASVIVKGPSDAPTHEASATSLTITVYESATGAFGGEETQIGQVTAQNMSANGATSTITCSGATSQGYLGVRCAGGSASDKFTIGEIEAYEVTAFTLVAAVGTYVLTGVAAGLGYGRQLAAAVGAYVLTGVASTGTKTKLLIAAAGAYVLSGQAVAFVAVRSLVAAVGTYTYTGIAVALGFGRVLAVAAGAYTYTGVAQILHYGRVALSFLQRRVTPPRLISNRSSDPQLRE